MYKRSEELLLFENSHKDSHVDFCRDRLVVSAALVTHLDPALVRSIKAWCWLPVSN